MLISDGHTPPINPAALHKYNLNVPHEIISDRGLFIIMFIFARKTYSRDFTTANGPVEKNCKCR